MIDDVQAHHRALFGGRPITPESLVEMDRILCSLPYYVDEDGVHRHTAPFGELSEYGLIRLVRRVRFVRDDQSEVVLTGVQIKRKEKP